MRIIACFLCLWGLVLGKAFAHEKSVEALKNIHKNLHRPVKSFKDEKTEATPTIAKIRSKMMGVMREIRQHDRELTDIQRKLNALERDRKQKEAYLIENDRNAINTLRLIQRFARKPIDEHVLTQKTSKDVVHSAILLKSVRSNLILKAQKVNDELNEMGGERRVLLGKKQSKLAEIQKLTHASESLIHELKSEREKAQRRFDRIMMQPSNLESLLDALERLDDPVVLNPTNTAHPVRPAVLQTPEGFFNFPLRGFLLSLYEEGDEQSQEDGRVRNKGVFVETGLGEVVEAPFDGRVAFAGPFLRYGQLIIIAHPKGYHALLAGIDVINKKVGDSVRVGEVIAHMPETAGGASPRLYLELRQNGVAIDPLPKLLGRKIIETKKKKTRSKA